MNNETDEKITRLYRKIEKSLPPEILDARIKKAAHQQIRKTKSRIAMRWASVAALVVLSVGIVLRVVQEKPLEQGWREQIEEAQSPEPAVIFEAETGQQDVEFDAVPEQAEKRLQAPAAARKKSREQSNETVFKAEKQQVMDTRPKGFQLAEPVTIDKQDWCGQPDLATIPEPSIWLERIAQLKQQNRFDEAQCLEKLFQAVISSKH